VLRHITASLQVAQRDRWIVTLYQKHLDLGKTRSATTDYVTWKATVDVCNRLDHRFSKCSVRSPRAPREKPRGSESYSFSFFVFIFRYLLWGSVNYGQSLHGLHNTKSLRTTGLVYVAHDWHRIVEIKYDYADSKQHLYLQCHVAAADMKALCKKTNDTSSTGVPRVSRA